MAFPSDRLRHLGNGCCASGLDHRQCAALRIENVDQNFGESAQLRGKCQARRSTAHNGHIHLIRAVGIGQSLEDGIIA